MARFYGVASSMAMQDVGEKRRLWRSARLDRPEGFPDCTCSRQSPMASTDPTHNQYFSGISQPLFVRRLAGEKKSARSKIDEKRELRFRRCCATGRYIDGGHPEALCNEHSINACAIAAGTGMFSLVCTVMAQRYCVWHGNMCGQDSQQGLLTVASQPTRVDGCSPSSTRVLE